MRFGILTLILLAACNFNIPKEITVTCADCAHQGPQDPKDPQNPPPVSVLTFKNVNNMIQGYCLRCHMGPGGSGGIDLSSYPKVMNYVVAGNSAASILCNVLEEGKMPPGSPLPKKMADAVCLWIQQGAKEQ